MRLDHQTLSIIKTEIAQCLGENLNIYLFGSRIDDNQRGGDIDLLIESPQVFDNRIVLECQLAARLHIQLGGRKVDVLIQDKATDEQPIYQQARQYGILL